MLSFLPVLVHDRDLPLGARAALRLAEVAPPGAGREAAKRQAAASLHGLFDLTEAEIADLVGLPPSAFEGESVGLAAHG